MSNIVKKVFDVFLDICHSVSTPEFTVVHGDSGVELSVHLKDSGEAVDLTDCFVQAVFLRSDGASSTIDSDGNGICITDIGELTLTLFPSCTYPGIVECELQIFSDADMSTLITSSKFNFRCRKPLLDDDTVAASPELPLLTDLLSDVKSTRKIIDEATSSAFIAAENASNATNECCNALAAIPDDLPLPFYRTLQGTEITVNDSHKGAKLKSCVILGKTSVTVSDDTLPISLSNPAAAESLMPTKLAMYYGEYEKAVPMFSVALDGITGTAIDEYDIVSGIITYKVAQQQFTGEESITAVAGEKGYPAYFSLPLSVPAKNYSALICTHFPTVEYDYGESIESTNSLTGCSIMENELRIRPSEDFSSVSEFADAIKALYAGGTPLSVFYERKEYFYSNNGSSIVLAPASSNFFILKSQPLTTVRITYSCDMNVFMNRAGIGTVLRRKNYSDLGFEWETLDYSDVGAAPFKHAHGNISASGAIGIAEDYPVFTGENGVLKTVARDVARDLLEVPSNYEFTLYKNTAPFIKERIIAPKVNLKNMRDESGLEKFLFKGSCVIDKVDAQSPISPDNIAAFTFFKPTQVCLSKNGTTAVQIIQLGDDAPTLYGFEEVYDTYYPLTGEYISIISSLTLTGDESWEYIDCDAPYFTMPLPNFDSAKATLSHTYCTHFEPVPYINGEPISESNSILGCSTHSESLSVRTSDFSTLDEWKAFLSSEYRKGTPVTVYYERSDKNAWGASLVSFPQITSAFTVSTNTDALIDVEYTSKAPEICRIESDLVGSVKTISKVTDACEYHFGTLTRLTVAANALPDTHYSFSLYFDSGESISISLPASIRWAGGTAPEFLPYKTYEISIKDGLGKVEVYNNA